VDEILSGSRKQRARREELGEKKKKKDWEPRENRAMIDVWGAGRIHRFGEGIRINLIEAVEGKYRGGNKIDKRT